MDSESIRCNRNAAQLLRATHAVVDTVKHQRRGCGSGHGSFKPVPGLYRPGISESHHLATAPSEKTYNTVGVEGCSTSHQSHPARLRDPYLLSPSFSLQKQINENLQNSPPPLLRPYPSRYLPFFFPFPLHFAAVNYIPILLFGSWYDYLCLLITHNLLPIHADDKTMTTTITTTAIGRTMSTTSSVNELIALTGRPLRFPSPSVWP